MGLAKGIIDASALPALDETLEQEVTAQELCATSEDFREGVRAFAERRPPVPRSLTQAPAAVGVCGYARQRLPEPVSIIGASGALGFGLAVRLARAGSQVVLGSRDPQRAGETVVRARAAVPDGTFECALNAEAAAASELVILAVPFRNQAETLHNLRDALRPGQIVIDATVPLAAAIGGKATRTVGVWQGSAAQQAQEMVPEGVTVVSALHTIGAASLRDLDRALDEDVLLAGDRRADKARVAALLDAHRRAALRRLRPPGDGAPDRAAHRAHDLDQRPLQDARRREAHRPARRAVARGPAAG